MFAVRESFSKDTLTYETEAKPQVLAAPPKKGKQKHFFVLLLLKETYFDKTNVRVASTTDHLLSLQRSREGKRRKQNKFSLKNIISCSAPTS
jgi:hypothetical protein